MTSHIFHLPPTPLVNGTFVAKIIQARAADRPRWNADAVQGTEADANLNRLLTIQAANSAYPRAQRPTA